MSGTRPTPEPGDADTQAQGQEEPFLQRWSRRKAEARSGAEDEPQAPVAGAAAELPAAAAATEAPGPVELPDLDSLDVDADFSAFMAPGVDDSLRRKALRKLFSNPKYNFRDGLDDYCDDFTQWAPLGDVVTADMRYHLERLAKMAERALEDGASAPPPAAPDTVAPDALAQDAVVPDAAGEPEPRLEAEHDDTSETHEPDDRPA